MADSKTSLLVVSDADVKFGRETFGVTDMNTFNENMDSILEWCEKEQHLAAAAKHINRNVLEKLFILSRGSIEGTKQKIEKLLTNRGMMPELVMKRTPEEFDKFLDLASYIPLPKFYPKEQSRVNLTRFLTDKLDDFDLLTYFRYVYLIGEYRLNDDYNLGERFILDMKHVHFNLLYKFNPVIVKKADILATEGYSTKIKGIHIVNAPSFVDKFVFLLKQTLKEKVASRLHVHNTLEDLHKHIPKEILPKEYGGDEESCEILAKKWREKIRTKEARDFMYELEHLISDESKRLSTKFAEEYMGMPGSFKRLNVD